MIMMSLLVYDVKGDGEIDNIDQLDKSILSSDRVLIVIAENNKKIYLWKGKNSPVRKKFVGARKAAALRTEYGFGYKVVAMDESDEEADFLALIGMKPSKASKPISTPVERASITVTPPTPEPELAPIAVEPTPEPEPKVVVKAQPRLKVTVAQPKVAVAQPEPNILSEDEIMTRLDKIEVPQGFVRELVISGHSLYAVKESKTSIFGKESIERKLERVNPPEGIFLAEDFIPRVLVENGVVQAVEFLKESPDIDYSSIEPLKEEMVAHLRDLVGAFKREKEKG
ncbi:MAG: hypothetical protein KIH08_02700 [Candidatus Freyarchaeota archaeon]|nr:hypothetical protein [Candidatus Jordarchaeia archaeon]